MQPKRLLLPILAVILICFSAVTLVAADEASPLKLAVEVSSPTAISKEPVTVQAGDALEVSVTVTGNPGISSLQFDLVYDPDVLSVKTDTITKGSAFSADSVDLLVSNGKISFVRLTIAAEANNGVVFKVTFNVKKAPVSKHGASLVSISNFYGVDRELNDVHATLENGEFHAHSKFGDPVTPEGACVKGDCKIYTCEDCKAKVTVGTPLEHTPEVIPAIAATCTEPGKTEGSKCSVCGEVLKAQEEIPATGHTVVTVPAIAATCTETGKTEGEYCSVCNQVLKEQEEIPATGHTVAKIPAVAATCTEAGKTEGEYCSVCNEILKAPEDVPALGHKPVEDPAVEPTADTEGKTAGTHCSVCGKILIPQETIPALGHSLVWLWILLAVVAVAAVGVVTYFFVFKKKGVTK